MPTLLRKKIKTTGSRKPRRLGPYGRLSRIWPLLFVSLLVDPLLPFVIHPQVPNEVALAVACGLAILLLPCLAQDRIQKMVSRLRTFSRKGAEQPSRAQSFMVLAAIVLTILPKVVGVAGISVIFLGAVIVIVALVVTVAFRRSIKQRAKDRDLLAEKPWLQIESWEAQLVLLLLIPMLAARGISLCGALVAGPPDAILARLPFFLVGAAFLAMLKPDKRLFLGHCKRCKLTVPIVLADFGSCVRCDQRLLASYVESLYPESVAAAPEEGTDGQGHSSSAQRRSGG